MSQKVRLIQELEEVECEYRSWLVEVIRLERGIDAVEGDLRRCADPHGPASSLYSRLAEVREKQRLLEEKLRSIRLRLDTLYAQLNDPSGS